MKWLDRFGGEVGMGREIRLINPKGEIVGRRLAVGAITEHHLFFRGNTAYTPVLSVQDAYCVYGANSRRATAPLDEPFVDALFPRRLRQSLWKRPVAVAGKGHGKQRSCTHRQCSRRLIERYRYLPRAGESATVEWRVCFQARPLTQGQKVPVCSELWWEGRLRRRHILLHYRLAIPRNPLSSAYRATLRYTGWSSQIFSRLFMHMLHR